MSMQTPVSMAMSYAMMCNYYELCIPGIESKNPHFQTSLHVIKRETSPTVENVNNLLTKTPLQQENKVTTPGGSKLKLLFKGKRDNKIHVKCSCNEITDGTAIKRKFLIKCNKCQAMVHGKCHNLNAQLFNSNNNHSSKWFCSTCTLDIQNEIRKNAMAEDIKRAVQTSPKPTSTLLTKANKVTRKKNSNKSKNNKSGVSAATNVKSKQMELRNSSSEKIETKSKKEKPKCDKATKCSKSKRVNEPNKNSQRDNSSEKCGGFKRPRYVPIQPKQS